VKDRGFGAIAPVCSVVFDGSSQDLVASRIAAGRTPFELADLARANTRLSNPGQPLHQVRVLHGQLKPPIGDDGLGMRRSLTRDDDLRGSRTVAYDIKPIDPVGASH
jgi:hypothetical protein